MWTPITRQQHSRTVTRYQTDLTDAEWRVIAPHLPKPCATGRPRVWPMREIVNGIFNVMRAGCPWRLLPKDLPPWGTIYRWFAAWRDDGCFERRNHALVMADRQTAALRAPAGITARWPACSPKQCPDDCRTGSCGLWRLDCRGLKAYAPRPERIVWGGGCGHSSQCSSPSRSALAAPIFLRLAPHGRRRGILDLEPVIDAAGAVGGAEALRDDAFAAQGTGVPEDNLTVAVEVPVEGDPVIRAAKEIGQRVLAVLKPRPPQVLAVEFD
jgi:transposase